jgi:hypothetical protein
LGYGSEVWGYVNGDDVEVVHNTFCKRVLRVKKSTQSTAILGELGRVPLALVRKERMLKYWCKLVNNRYGLVFSAYTQLRDNADKSLDYPGLNWASQIKYILQSLGCFEVWLYQDSSGSCWSS